MSHPSSGHFGGRSVAEHLKEARMRGAVASAEVHGAEMPGHFAAGADSAKETAIILLILWILLSFFLSFEKTFLFLSLFCGGWIVWKTARSALLGWARIERLHRVIEEERWEIEHHRHQERAELTEMYRAKGLSGKLLEEVVDVLMADDNRLLQLMLEEELGLTLEVYEHPLKQAAGAFFGALLSSLLCLFGLWLFPAFGLPVTVAIALTVATKIATRLERSRFWNSLIWHLGVTALAGGLVYFLAEIFR